MNLSPKNQTKLYGLENHLEDFIKLYDEKKLPNKILLSGLKGIGKSTLSYHFINYVLSKNEEFFYDLKNTTINSNNRTFKLIQNGTNPNFYLIDVDPEKKNIDIQQIRNLINDLNKSSFNIKPRFVLIDNIDYLNLNSINALLKILEEPNDNIHFILINNNKKIASTLLSRCLNFKISLTKSKINEINRHLFEEDISNLINSDLVDYYYTPGKIFNLLKFSEEKEIDIKNLDTKNFLSLIIKKAYYKDDNRIRNLLYDMVEFYLLKKVSLSYSEICSKFLRKIHECKKFNLDNESLFLEINSKILNG